MNTELVEVDKERVLLVLTMFGIALRMIDEQVPDGNLEILLDFLEDEATKQRANFSDETIADAMRMLDDDATN